MFCVAWYWNLRFVMCCSISKYLQEHCSTVYVVRIQGSTPSPRSHQSLPNALYTISNPNNDIDGSAIGFKLVLLLLLLNARAFKTIYMSLSWLIRYLVVWCVLMYWTLNKRSKRKAKQINCHAENSIVGDCP